MHFKIIILLFIFFPPLPSFANEIEAATIIKGCEEALEIFDDKGEEGVLSRLSTSAAEAMRAGICRGVIFEHLTHDARCRKDWSALANEIAQANKLHSLENILKNACK